MYANNTTEPSWDNPPDWFEPRSPRRRQRNESDCVGCYVEQKEHCHNNNIHHEQQQQCHDTSSSSYHEHHDHHLVAKIGTTTALVSAATIVAVHAHSTFNDKKGWWHKLRKFFKHHNKKHKKEDSESSKDEYSCTSSTKHSEEHSCSSHHSETSQSCKQEEPESRCETTDCTKTQESECIESPKCDEEQQPPIQWCGIDHCAGECEASRVYEANEEDCHQSPRHDDSCDIKSDTLPVVVCDSSDSEDDDECVVKKEDCVKPHTKNHVEFKAELSESRCFETECSSFITSASSSSSSSCSEYESDIEQEDKNEDVKPKHVQICEEQEKQCKDQLNEEEIVIEGNIFPGNTANGQVKIFYLSAGFDAPEEKHEKQRPTIVLIHGVPLSSETYECVMESLVDEGYQVIAPDLRGFGRSDKPTDLNVYTLAHFVTDLHELLGWLQIQHPIILGHDLGGMIALQYASQMVGPQAASKLILQSSSAKYVNDNTYFDGVPATDFAHFLSQLNADTSLRQFVHRYNATALSDPTVAATGKTFLELLEFVDGISERTRLDIVRRLFVNLETIDLRPVLPSITIPTLVVFGSRDQTLPPGASLFLADQLSDAFVEEIRGAAHYLQLTYFKALVSRILGFLEERFETSSVCIPASESEESECDEDEPPKCKPTRVAKDFRNQCKLVEIRGSDQCIYLSQDSGSTFITTNSSPLHPDNDHDYSIAFGPGPKQGCSRLYILCQDRDNNCSVCWSDNDGHNWSTWTAHKNCQSHDHQCLELEVDCNRDSLDYGAVHIITTTTNNKHKRWTSCDFAHSFN